MPRQRFQLDLSARGYQILFWVNETNRCPGCGHSQWFVGRITAECGVCATTLSLAESELAGFNPSGQRAVALHVGSNTGKPVKADERRSEDRVSAAGRTIALYVDGSPRPFHLRNISPGGAMGLTLPGLTEAVSLKVELEDGTMVPAELRWNDGQSAGLAFVWPAVVNDKPAKR
ncbi:MAG: PilZ domain-containing protein [Novosphingobium sp.]